MKGDLFICVAGIAFATVALPGMGVEGARTREPIALTSEQVLNLKNAADSLAMRKQVANSKFSGYEARGDVGQIRTTSLSTVAEAEREVKKMQEGFVKSFKTKEARQASRIFFGDILTRYSAGTETIRMFKANEYSLVRDSTFLLLDQNYMAYSKVAQQQSLTFNLQVQSNPPLASVSYKRRGDKYTIHPSLTDTSITNLVLAIWLVRVELQDHVPQEKEHDPFREENHVVSFALKHK